MKSIPRLPRIARSRCSRPSFIAAVLVVVSMIAIASEASAQSVCGSGQSAELVAVTFAPERASDNITLQIQTVTGARVVCNAPCVVNVPPGYISITGSGSRNFESGLDVPDWPITVVVNHYDPPVGAYVAGGILTGLGAAGTVASAVLMADQTHCVSPSSSAGILPFESCRNANETHEVVGGIGLGISLTFLLVGPLILGTAAGHGRHPLTLMSPGELLHRSISTRGPDVHLTGLAVSPIPGGAIAGASVSF